MKEERGPYPSLPLGMGGEGGEGERKAFA